MASLPEFKHDIFISYAHVDNKFPSVDELLNHGGFGKSTELLQTKLEDLKTIIHEKLNPPPPPAVVAPPLVKSDSAPATVYLICDQQDYESVAPIEDFLFGRGLNVLSTPSEFLAKSQTARATAKQALEQERLAKLKRTRRVALILAVAFLIALASACYSYWQRNFAIKQQAIAEDARPWAELSAESARLSNRITTINSKLLERGNTPADSEFMRDFYLASRDPLGQAVVLVRLGEMYEQTKPGEVLQSYQTAYELLTRWNWKWHPFAAKVLNQLGQTYFKAGQLSLTFGSA